MTHPTRLLVAALAATAVSLPAATSAQAAKPKAATVGAHVKKAQGAQARVATLVKRGDVTGAKRVLKTARREATTAARQAQQLADNAGTSQKAGENAIWSLTTAAGNLGAAIQQFSDLLPQASADFQAFLANAIPGSIAGREELLASLTDLVQELTGQAQAMAAKALAALQSQSPEQVSALAETAATDLPSSIADIINKAMAAASSALSTGLSELGDVIPNLPASVQPLLTSALGMVQSTIEGILPMVQQITSSVGDIVEQVLSMVTGILGGHHGNGDSGDYPGAGSGTGSTGAAGGGLLGNLLSGITGMLPKFGGMLGGFFS